MSAALELNLDFSALSPQEQAWIDSGAKAQEWTERVLDGGAVYLALPEVGPIAPMDRTSPAPAIPFVALVTVAVGVGLAMAEKTIAGLVILTAGLVGIASRFVKHGLRSSSVGSQTASERWTAPGLHGVLLTPDALLLRRPTSVSRVRRSAVIGIERTTVLHEEQPEREDTYASDPVLSGTRAHRRVIIRISDSRSMFEVVAAESVGKATVLGATHDLPPGAAERLDTLEARLRRWVETVGGAQSPKPAAAMRANAGAETDPP